MAEKKPTVIIKKVTVVSGGAHGGAWKVAFADFMTAMMAFFLVMWLLATSTDQSKSAISDYFSTPSVIEYQFNNFGVELTLEKLFLDLINEPLKAFQAFVTPMDHTPNVMAMGMKKVIMAYMADELGSMAKNVEVEADRLVFEIPDSMLFERGTAYPSPQFVDVMERLKGVTAGLEDSDVLITSIVYRESIPGQDPRRAKNISQERLDLLEAKVKGSLENASVDVRGKAVAKRDDRGPNDNQAGGGLVRFEIKQKEILSDGSKPKPIVESVFGQPESDKSVYENFVNQVSKRKSKGSSQPPAKSSRSTGGP